MPMISSVRLANWAGGLWAALVSAQAKLSKASRMLFMENSSVLGAGRDVPRSWGELTPIEPAQQPGFLHTPRGVCNQKARGPFEQI